MILVTGPTGNIGSLLIPQLLQRRASVRALVRDPDKDQSKVDALRAQGVEIARGDLVQPDTLPASLQGVERVFLLTPVSQETAVWKGNMIQAARTAGVRHIVNLSVTAAAADAPFSLGRWHWQAEQELEGSGVAWTHLRPTDLARYGTQGFLATAREQGAFYSTVGTGRVAMVDEADVAAVAAEALTKPAEHAGKTYALTGPTAYTYPELAKQLSAALGRPVRYVNVTPAQAKETMLKLGIPEWIADFVNDLRETESKGLVSAVSPDVERVTGRPATPYADTLKAVLA